MRCFYNDVVWWNEVFFFSIIFFSVLQAPVDNPEAEVDFGLVNNFCKHRLVNVLRGRPRNGFRGCVSTGTENYFFARSRSRLRVRAKK